MQKNGAIPSCVLASSFSSSHKREREKRKEDHKKKQSKKAPLPPADFSVSKHWNACIYLGTSQCMPIVLLRATSGAYCVKNSGDEWIYAELTGFERGHSKLANTYWKNRSYQRCIAHTREKKEFSFNVYASKRCRICTVCNS